MLRLHASSGTEVVDGLRGLAVLLVVSFHTYLFSWLTPSLTVFGFAVPLWVVPRTGFLGVDLFFLISGFCLCFPYARAHLEGKRAPEVRDFAERRFVKIVPSYALALTATVLVALPAFSNAADLGFTVFNHAFFFNNSFDDRLGYTNSVFWSLAPEVQFYLLFPFLIGPFVRRPLVVAGLMAAAALGYRLWFAGCCLSLETVMRQLPAYLDVFACGMLAAYAFVYLRGRLPDSPRTRALATVLAIGLAAAAWQLLCQANASLDLPAGHQRWEVVHRTLLAAVVGAMTVASCFAARWWRVAIGNPALVFLSLISYNLYLWHTLVEIWMVNHRIPAPSTADPHADPAWQVVYVLYGVGASLAISAAITYFIERPILSVRKPLPFSFSYRRGRPIPAPD